MLGLIITDLEVTHEKYPQQDESVLGEGAEYEKYARDDPGLHGVQPVRPGRAHGHSVEYVHLEQKRGGGVVRSFVVGRAGHFRYF